jgi:AGZA family xanthine/uracil permease-like MFS transporter
VVHGARAADAGVGARTPSGRSERDRTIGSGRRAPSWISQGDLNGFLGLALDNTTQLVILSGLLIGVFKFPPDLVLFRMLPGTAIGVLAGDLVYTWLALRLMRATGRSDVTAMPFGIDTPTLFAMVFGVLGPVMLATGDPILAWKVAMAVTIAIGVVKTALAFAGDWVRRVVPRAALLGSIGGVAIFLIAFLPSLKLFADPMTGLVALGVLFLALFGRVRMPLGIPGAFAAVLAGTAVFWGRAWLVGGGEAVAAGAGHVQFAIPWPTLVWMDAIPHALGYLSIALPFALVTVVGGIDNTESASAAGDHYRTRDVLLTEAGATILAGLCGGVIQNTPYIGHPAYKAMGARSGYTLATGLVIGLGAMAGVLPALVRILPEAAVAPILVFIGLEITAQAFLASPQRHGAAVAITFVPVAAAMVLLEVGSVLTAAGTSAGALTGEAAAIVGALRVLGNGFVLTAVLWGSALAAIVDRRLAAAAVVFAIASAATLFGLVHSPLESGALFWPWTLPSLVSARLAGAYGILAALCLGLSSRAVAPDVEAESR